MANIPTSFIKIFNYLLIFLSINLYASYWDSKDVSTYVHHSELQRRWAWAFLAPHIKSLKGDEFILDIGCGDGKISADLSKFVPDGKVIGIDPCKSMICWAKKQYHCNEYPNLLFRVGDFLNPNTQESFDLVVSFCAFQHCSEPKEALERIYSLLKKDGKLLILIPAMNNDALNQAIKITQKREDWADYWKSFKPRKFLQPAQYVDLLSLCKFQVVKVEEVKTMDPFINRNEILNWFEGTFPIVISPEKSRQFYEQLIDDYLKLDSQAIEDNVIYAKLGYIVIEAIRL